jgi:hypothetical protein
MAMLDNKLKVKLSPAQQLRVRQVNKYLYYQQWENVSVAL